MQKRGNPAVPIGVVQFGLGPIGCGIVRLAARKAGLEVVGAVDVDPNKVGRDVGEVAGAENTLGCRVASRLEEALNGVQPGVAFHATGSSLAMVKPQLEALIAAGLNVVSTCEELAYPWRRHPDLAAEIDALARQHGVTVLGTGVNPGFVMDTLATVVTALSPHVSQVRISRHVDAAQRRGPLQRKTGAGMTVEEFQRLAAAGQIGHVGLPESLDFVVDALGFQPQEVREEIRPVIATRPFASPFVQVEPGQVAGLHQEARAWQDGREVVSLILEMSVEMPHPGDTIEVFGPPDMVLRLQGVHGDVATAAVVVNSAPRVVAARPGLVTMKDLPIVSALRDAE